MDFHFYYQLIFNQNTECQQIFGWLLDMSFEFRLLLLQVAFSVTFIILIINPNLTLPEISPVLIKAIFATRPDCSPKPHRQFSVETENCLGH